MSKNFHLFETLSKMKISLEHKGQVVRINDPSDINYLDKYYKNQHEFSNNQLCGYKSGWLKYNCYFFDKPLTIHNRNYKIRNILHLLHSSESDIIISRIIRFDKKEEKYSIGYLIIQKNKEQICRNIVEMNLSLKNGFQYDGRQLFKSDFEPEETKEEK